MVVQNGQVNFVGHAGDEGEFKLGDKTLVLAAAGESQPVTNATQYQVFTSAGPRSIAPAAVSRSTSPVRSAVRPRSASARSGSSPSAR